jgi:hypothetical protein
LETLNIQFSFGCDLLLVSLIATIYLSIHAMLEIL